MLSLTDYDTLTTTYDYTGSNHQFAGLPASMTDAQGNVSTFGYDALGRTTSTAYSGGSPSTGDIAQVLQAYNDGTRTVSRTEQRY